MLVCFGVFVADGQETQTPQELAQNIIQDFRTGQRQEVVADVNAKIATLQGAVATNSTDGELFFALSICFMEQDNKTEGLKNIEKAYQLMPDDPQIGALYVLALKMDKQPDRAIKVAKTVANLHPDNAALQVQVATLEMTVQRYGEALVILEDLEAKAPENLDPREKSVLLFMLGNCYFYSGNYAKATEVLNNAISLTPRMATANAVIGEIYVKTGNIDLASTNLDKALAVNPRYPGALFYKGICLEKSGKAELAQDYYLKAYQNQIRYLQDNGEDYFLMSLICQKIGKGDEAKRNRDEAAKLLYTYEAPWQVK